MRLKLATLAVLAAAPAMAHDGHHETLPAAEQLRHLLTQPDHLMAAATLVAVIVAGGWTWRRAKARR